jgi:hypothetical protein
MRSSFSARQALVATASAAVLMLGLATTSASADVVSGCTHNSSFLTSTHLHLAGLMTGCPRGTLKITSEYYYDGALIPEHENECKGSTGCAVATTDTYLCFAPGNYTLRIKGQHGGAVDYADVDTVLSLAAAEASPACSASRLAEYANESPSEVAAQLGSQ